MIMYRMGIVPCYGCCCFAQTEECLDAVLDEAVRLP